MEGAGRKVNLPLALLFWAVMVVIAIINGIIGEKLIKGLAGDYTAHLYKTFFIITVIFVFSRVYLKKAAAGGASIYSSALSAGLTWLACSLTFEFLAGHYIFGFPWDKLTADYRIWRGRLWSLVLASEVIAPLLNAWLMKRT